MPDEQWTRAEAHWREHHPKQPYADKSLTFEDYVPAYQTGHEGAQKHAGKKFEEIEDDLALDYRKRRPGSSVPWDTVRPAVKAEWDRLAGVIAPHDTDRGIRSGI